MIGIIGGTGLDNPKILSDCEEKDIKTPFGKPAAPITIGCIGKRNVAIVSRHGKSHEFSPSNVPYRANIWALKELGCHTILASTACGSLKEEFKPGSIVFPSQFIDWTKKRENSFFEKGKVVHVPMAKPFCADVKKILVETAQELGLKFHESGTVVTIEGPRFSTKAESNMFRSMGADIINMTTVPEIVLARELGICYQSIAMVTDYDCWKDAEEAVTIEAVMKIMKENSENVKNLFLKAVPGISGEKTCSCAREAENAGI